MLITLNTEDVLRLVLVGLKAELAVTPAEIFLGPVNGKLVAVAGIGEGVPQGTFDDDDEEEPSASQAEASADQTTAEPRKRRKRRTKEEIAADEAAAAALAAGTTTGETAKEPEAKQELKPEAQTQSQEKTSTGAEEDLFGTEPETKTEPKAETKDVVTAAGQDPFNSSDAGPVTDDALDLFSDANANSDASNPATTIEDGFVKPADDVLDLFE